MVLGHRLIRSGLTRVLDRMERVGLVERSLSRGDRRQFEVARSAPAIGATPISASLRASLEGPLARSRWAT